VTYWFTTRKASYWDYHIIISLSWFLKLAIGDLVKFKKKIPIFLE